MKNKDILLDVIGDVDEKLVPELTEKKKKSSILKWASFSGVCAAAIVCAFTLPKLLDSKDYMITSSQSESDPAISEKTECQNNQNNSTAEGVYLPVLELPESSEAVNMDMIGLVVYKGRIYMQAEDYLGEKAQKIESLVGEHLGTAKGNIDEWSTQDEYATEFASTISGEVYSVNGYDTDFRICILGEAEDENNNKIMWIQFLDRLNDITLTKGTDLFEDRLHIRERTDIIQFQNHEDWDWNSGNIQNANIDTETWEEFWTQIDNGEFINTWDPNAANSIYDTPNQAHLILTMNDGTIVRLRLIEGGYVSYDALGWYFVKIPEDVFNAVYDACGGTH